MRKLAIVSVNRNKYSETFIHSHFHRLENVVAVYSDGLFPVSVSYDRANSFQPLVKERWWKKQVLKEALKKSLRDLGVEVLLVEYGPSGVELLSLCAELKLPMIVHFHGYDAYRDDVMENQGKLYPELFAQAGAVVVVSQDMRTRLLAMACPPEKLALIPYGVQCQEFQLPAELTHEKKILYCGRFVAKKNPLGVLKATIEVLKVHADASLIMIGDGPLLEEAVNYAQGASCRDRIVFEGVRTPKEVAEKMKECSVFIQLSGTTADNDSEGTPLALMEAMASGMLVLGTRHAGIQELIHHGTNGFIVDEKSLQAQLLDVFSKVQCFDSLRMAARQTILDNYTLERYINELQALINRL